MSKDTIIEKIHNAAGISKAQAETALKAMLNAITDEMADGGQVGFTGFGTFKVVERAKRKGRNPRTGAEIDLPASRAVKFVPGKGLKDAARR